MIATLFRTLWGWGVLVWLSSVRCLALKGCLGLALRVVPMVRIGARMEGTAFRDSAG